MYKYLILCFAIAGFSACHPTRDAHTHKTAIWTPYDDSADVAASASHADERMRYKFIQSKVLDKNEVFGPLHAAVAAFTDAQYQQMKPWVLEQDIPTIQGHITDGKFTYEALVLFYLHRIYKYELPNATTLNTVIALNPNVLEEARQLDAHQGQHHPIYGMPILLKDNIGTAAMRTTAGAVALQYNQTDDAFIVARLKEKGALILGKVNLSEWANFLCAVCPNGQSAVGGQTLNPYGRRTFDTGGSSAGSGTSIAANYAVAAVGTETSGSILSPSSQNSVVGLKPTVGLLSRTGIVPISSTLDTPGPMTKNVTDNAILLNAMLGKDPQDPKSVAAPEPVEQLRFQDTRLGVFKDLLEQSAEYAAAVAQLRAAGVQLVTLEAASVPLDGFLTLLNVDMRYDLAAYLQTAVKDKTAVSVRTVADVVAFNQQDTLVRIPYGQARFEGIVADTTSAVAVHQIKRDLKAAGRSFFQALASERLDAILSINNYHAGYAAVAEYPALTVPMGYQPDGEPISLTFIGLPFSEASLLRIGKQFEMRTQARKIPAGYQE